MKNLLRESILEKRNSLSEQEVKSKSEIIKNSIFSMREFKDSKVVMFYVSFNSEVDTHEMIKEALKSKRIAVPKVVEKEMQPSLLIDFDQMIPFGKFDILEPIELLKIELKNISLIIIPGIAFDRKGHRIGYGYGYYDKFLRKIPKAVKIGIAFDFQIADKIPNEAHDVPLDIIVTEKEVIEC